MPVLKYDSEGEPGERVDDTESVAEKLLESDSVTVAVRKNVSVASVRDEVEVRLKVSVTETAFVKLPSDSDDDSDRVADGVLEASDERLGVCVSVNVGDDEYD